MTDPLMFDAVSLGFYPQPKFSVVLQDERFKLVDLQCNQEVDRVGAGVYVWAYTPPEGNQPEARYVGLFGKRAKRPNFRRRMHQHLRGLNSSLKGRAPTRHWESVFVPRLQADLASGGTIHLYLQHADSTLVDDLETELIGRLAPPWNAAKTRGRKSARCSRPAASVVNRLRPAGTGLVSTEDTPMADIRPLKERLVGANELLASLWASWETSMSKGSIELLQQLCDLAHRQGLDIYTTGTGGVDIRFGVKHSALRGRAWMYFKLVCTHEGIQPFVYKNGTNEPISFQTAEAMLREDAVTAWRRRRGIANLPGARASWPADFQ